MTPLLLILSAPSGAGKTTIARALERRRDDVGYSISATTRAPRQGERDGVDYYYLDPAEFQRRVDAGEFLEWAEYGGKRYGTLRAEIERLTGSGQHALLDIEVQGAAQVRTRWEKVRSVFIIPPSARDLLDRLGGRRTEDPAAIRTRLDRALHELDEADTYDHIVVNDDLERAVATVSDLLDGRDAGADRHTQLSTLAQLRAELETELARQDASRSRDADHHAG